MHFWQLIYEINKKNDKWLNDDTVCNEKKNQIWDLLMVPVDFFFVNWIRTINNGVGGYGVLWKTASI